MAITAQQAIDAAKLSKGNVTVIAKNLGCTRRYVYDLMKKYVTFRDVVMDERDQVTDIAESKLFSLIEQENITAIIFYLKTQGKDRGYVERHDIDIKVQQELSNTLDQLQDRLDSETYQKVLDAITGTGEISETETSGTQAALLA